MADITKKDIIQDTDAIPGIIFNTTTDDSNDYIIPGSSVNAALSQILDTVAVKKDFRGWHFNGVKNLARLAKIFQNNAIVALECNPLHSDFGGKKFTYLDLFAKTQYLSYFKAMQKLQILPLDIAATGTILQDQPWVLNFSTDNLHKLSQTIKKIKIQQYAEKYHTFAAAAKLPKLNTIVSAYTDTKVAAQLGEISVWLDSDLAKTPAELQNCLQLLFVILLHQYIPQRLRDTAKKICNISSDQGEYVAVLGVETHYGLPKLQAALQIFNAFANIYKFYITPQTFKDMLLGVNVYPDGAYKVEPFKQSMTVIYAQCLPLFNDPIELYLTALNEALTARIDGKFKEIKDIIDSRTAASNGQHPSFDFLGTTHFPTQLIRLANYKAELVAIFEQQVTRYREQNQLQRRLTPT